MVNKKDTSKIRAYLVGGANGLDEIRMALTHHDEIELLGSSLNVSAAVEEFATWDVDVVLYGTNGPTLSTHELAGIREHTPSPIILLAPASEPSLLEQALGADLADALLLPQPAEGVIFAIRKVADRRGFGLPDASGRIITVFSPKGGTGKTITATNLGVAIAVCHQQRTLLVDLDLQFGDSAVALGLQPQATIYNLVSAPGELDAEKLQGYTTHHDCGLEVVAAPARPEEAELIPIPRIVRLLEVARESFDVVVVDTAPFLHGPILTALDHTDELLMMATLDVPTLKNVRQSLETLELISFPSERIALVLNRANAQAGIKRGDVEVALEQRVRYVIPDDPAAQLAVNRGLAVLLAEPQSDFARAVQQMADALLRETAPRRAARDAALERS
jgi:pilus assembly protein CpaE